MHRSLGPTGQPPLPAGSRLELRQTDPEMDCEAYGREKFQGKLKRCPTSWLSLPETPVCQSSILMPYFELRHFNTADLICDAFSALLSWGPGTRLPGPLILGTRYKHYL